MKFLPPQFAWKPVPQQAPVTERMIDSAGTKLWCWDTGGAGEVIFLSHPLTGSGAIWGYQQPVFSKAGYRVVGYSRRGYYKSDAGPAHTEATAIDDIKAIVDALELDRFHFVGVAAGGFFGADFGLSHPGRVKSLTVANSLLGNFAEPDFKAVTDRITPKPFEAMPAELRELGPSYRAACPEGVAAWKALEEIAVHTPIRARFKNELNWKNLSNLQTPSLLLTGDADMYLPPSRLRIQATHLKVEETIIIGECGHAPYWEQPNAFNAAILDFIGRH